jgi:ankyrin repeat protein
MEEVQDEYVLQKKGKSLEIIPALQKFYHRYVPESFTNQLSILQEMLERKDKKISRSEVMYTSVLYALDCKLDIIAFTNELVLSEIDSLLQKKLQPSVESTDNIHQEKINEILLSFSQKVRVAMADRLHSPLDGSELNEESREQFIQDTLQVFGAVFKNHEAFSLAHVESIDSELERRRQIYDSQDELMIAIFDQKNRITMEQYKDVGCHQKAQDVNKEVVVRVKEDAIDHVDRFQLHLSCSLGDMSAVRTLVNAYWIIYKRTRFINRQDDLGQSALHYAVQVKPNECKTIDVKTLLLKSQFEIVKFLLEYYADPNLPNHAGYTAFHLACKYAPLDIVQLLHHHGAKPNIKAVSIKERDFPVPPGIEQGYLRSPLHMAAFKGRSDVVRFLLDIKVEIDPCADNNKTPLLDACFNGHLETVKLLVERGANIEARGYDARSPLHSACIAGHVQIATFLCQKGAAFDEKGVGSINDVMQVSQKLQQQEMIEFLIGRSKVLHLESLTKEQLKTISEVDQLYQIIEAQLIQQTQERVSNAKIKATQLIGQIYRQKTALLDSHIRKVSGVTNVKYDNLPELDPVYLSTSSDKVRYFEYFVGSLSEGGNWTCTITDNDFVLTIPEDDLIHHFLFKIYIEYLKNILPENEIKLVNQDNRLTISVYHESTKQLILDCLTSTGIMLPLDKAKENRKNIDVKSLATRGFFNPDRQEGSVEMPVAETRGAKGKEEEEDEFTIDAEKKELTRLEDGYKI